MTFIVLIRLGQPLSSQFCGIELSPESKFLDTSKLHLWYSIEGKGEKATKLKIIEAGRMIQASDGVQWHK